MQKARAQAVRWEHIEADSPLPGVHRKRIVGQEAMISRFELERGSHVPTHSHANEQFACVLSGRVRFTVGVPELDEEVLEVVGGGVLYLPAHVPHAARALEDSIVMDVFAPVSEDTGVDRKASPG